MMKKIAMSHNFPMDRFAGELSGLELICPAEPLARFSDAQALKAIQDADVFICIRDFPCDQKMIEAGQNLKIIGNLGSGFNNVDVESATKKGIFVLNTPTSVIEPTAEMTIALMLAVCRSVARYDRELRETKICVPTLLLERDMCVSGKTLGVLGFGKIGRSVAKKAAGLGMKIIYNDVFRAPEDIEKRLDAIYLPADEVIASADVVTLHIPYLDENHHYMDDRKLSLMKKTAYLINASRGPIVSEQALVSALKNGRIAGAALDVHEFEPNISEEIAALDNIVITPHVCTNIAQERINMMGELMAGIDKFKKGAYPDNIVNLSLLDKR